MTAIHYRLSIVLLFCAVSVDSFFLGRFSKEGGGLSGGVQLLCDPTTLQALAIPKTVVSAKQAAVVTTQNIATGQYFASKNGTKYYPAGCTSAQKRIKPENIIWFQAQDEALLQGFTRGSSC